MLANNHHANNTDCVILAGGLGTRLRGIICDRNKVASTIKDKPFICHLLDRLDYFGFERIVICSGFKANDLRSRLNQFKGHLKLIFSKEPAPLGTAGAIRHALPLLKQETVLVLNGDSYCDVDIDQLITRHREAKAAASLTAVWVRDVGAYGSLQIEADGTILTFNEKKSAGRPGHINAGVYVFQTALLETIPGGMVSLEHDMLPRWVGKGLHAVRHQGLFFDIGTPSSYAKAQVIFASIAESEKFNDTCNGKHH